MIPQPYRANERTAGLVTPANGRIRRSGAPQTLRRSKHPEAGVTVPQAASHTSVPAHAPDCRDRPLVRLAPEECRDVEDIFGFHFRPQTIAHRTLPLHRRLVERGVVGSC
jgi:hypothetical protein